MKICLILEGSYPYVHGGVSTWMHQYITEMKEHEFVLWVVGATHEQKGKFVYELPENVVEVHEVFLDYVVLDKEEDIEPHQFTDEEKQVRQKLSHAKIIGTNRFGINSCLYYIFFEDVKGRYLCLFNGDRECFRALFFSKVLLN